MNKTEKKKLYLNVETIRRLNPEALGEAVGGLSIAQTACVCHQSNMECSPQESWGSCISECM